ncbi:kinase-like domain-containing protein [Hyaloraphidium curvatum]|nr:kinase-like domain-containing protein [Hyaloraphidium curvatum]
MAVRSATGGMVALKSTPRRRCEDAWVLHPASDVREAELRRRFEALAALRHPNLIRVEEFFATRDKFYDLEAFLRRNGPLSEADIRSALQCILGGLAFLHSSGIAHRDVKSSNVLLRRRGDPSSAALAEFDGSFVAPSGQAAPPMRTLIGTPYLLAPKVVDGGEYGPQIDMYSTGCIAFQLACGRTRFEDSRSLFGELGSGAAEALEHPFFAKASWRLSGVPVVFDESAGVLTADLGVLGA